MITLVESDLLRLAQCAFKIGHAIAQEGDNHRACLENALNNLVGEFDALGWVWYRGRLTTDTVGMDISPMAQWSEQISSVNIAKTQSNDLSNLSNLLHNVDWECYWSEVQKQQSPQSFNLSAELLSSQPTASNTDLYRLIRCRIDTDGMIDWLEVHLKRDDALFECKKIIADTLLENSLRCVKSLRQSDLDCQLEDLPKRQQEVLALLLQGASIKEIATELGISPYTVNDYSRSLYRHFQVAGRAELAARFMDNLHLPLHATAVLQQTVSS